MADRRIIYADELREVYAEWVLRVRGYRHHFASEDELATRSPDEIARESVDYIFNLRHELQEAKGG